MSRKDDDISCCATIIAILVLLTPALLYVVSRLLKL